jgi:hypothetical protein
VLTALHGKKPPPRGGGSGGKRLPKSSNATPSARTSVVCSPPSPTLNPLVSGSSPGWP